MRVLILSECNCLFVDASSELISSASDCCCNLTLGEPKACIQVAKAVTPYLISHLHGLNYALMVRCKKFVSDWVVEITTAMFINLYWTIINSKENGQSNFY